MMNSRFLKFLVLFLIGFSFTVGAAKANSAEPTSFSLEECSETTEGGSGEPFSSIDFVIVFTFFCISTPEQIFTSFSKYFDLAHLFQQHAGIFFNSDLSPPQV